VKVSIDKRCGVVLSPGAYRRNSWDAGGRYEWYIAVPDSYNSKQLTYGDTTGKLQLRAFKHAGQEWTLNPDLATADHALDTYEVTAIYHTMVLLNKRRTKFMDKIGPRFPGTAEQLGSSFHREYFIHNMLPWCVAIGGVWTSEQLNKDPSIGTRCTDFVHSNDPFSIRIRLEEYYDRTIKASFEG
jgi:hypothetical protein